MENNLPPNAVLVPPLKNTDYLRGDLTYEHRAEDWRPYLPTPRQQKFKFDTNECSQLSGINSIATQFNYLRDRFSIGALQWFSDNGYLDENGKFAFSERFTAILAGCSINGSSQISFWDAVRKYGLLPRADLSYTLEESQKFSTQEEMCDDYYDRSVLTSAMYVKAKQSLQYFTINYEYTWYDLDNSCPDELIADELKHAPLHIATPVCSDWNTGKMFPCGKKHPAHATMLFDQNDDISADIRDHYNPYDKVMSNDYFIPIIIKGIVNVKVPEEKTVSLSVLMQFIHILKQIGAWTVKGLKGII